MVSSAGSVLALVVVVGALAAGGQGPSGPGPSGPGASGVADPGGARVEVSARAVFVFPLPGSPAVVHPFAAPAAIWAPGHRGVDLAGAPGADVAAPAAGTVTFAGTVVDRGVLVITHDGGLRTTLEPVAPLVRVGTRVAAGDVVGTIGDVAGHCAPASCLHWGVRRGELYLDPLVLLAGARPVVLLPDP